MIDSNHRIVHIDSTIELKESFRAYLDVVKTSLIVSCLIVALVIGALTYFFILIGEQAMLWKLSPLLFGAPVVAIAAQLLRVHAAYRKYHADLSESEQNKHYTFPENGDGFDVVQGKNSAHVAWESVRSVVERPRYFRFVLGKPNLFIIPKRFFRSDSDKEIFKEIIIFHLGSKAKLLRE